MLKTSIEGVAVESGAARRAADGKFSDGFQGMDNVFRGEAIVG
jgi:hypothetical protein